jgi:TIR domain
VLIERLKAFISYSTKDKKLAAALKDCLTEYGLDVFLAHDDIEPSAAWVQTILAELSAADVFLPLLSDNFPDSKFTDQETGVAIAGDTLIIPLKVDIDPYGFIASIQALTLDPSRSRAACIKIARTIGQNPQRRGKFLDGLIEMFAESYSFAKAAEYASMLNEFEGPDKRVLCRSESAHEVHRGVSGDPQHDRHVPPENYAAHGRAHAHPQAAGGFGRRERRCSRRASPHRPCARSRSRGSPGLASRSLPHSRGTSQ